MTDPLLNLLFLPNLEFTELLATLSHKTLPQKLFIAEQSFIELFASWQSYFHPP